MQHQEIAHQLETIANQFTDATLSLEQIFSDLNITSQVSVPREAPITSKIAASAAIVSENENVMQQAAQPESILVAMQLAKVGDKLKICLPGGAVLSNEELAWIDSHPGEAAPPNLFYVLAQEQLVKNGHLNFAYDLDLAGASFTSSLRKNLIRELGEELGGASASQVRVNTFLPEQRKTTLSTIKLPSVDVTKQVAEQLAQRGVKMTAEGNLQGIYTEVTERVAIAHGPLEQVQAHSTDNPEAKGIRVLSLGVLLKAARETASSIEAFQNFRNLSSNNLGTDGIRNPSTTWGLGLLANWLKDLVISADPYNEGPKR